MNTARRNTLLLLGWLLLSTTARAEIRLTLKLNPVSAMQYETVNAYVSVLNNSSEIFVLDDEDKENKNKVFFTVERKRDEHVGVLDDRMPVRKMKIASGGKQDFISEISSLHDLSSTGRYVVRAVILLGTVRYESNPVVFDVVRGVEIASVTKELPGYPDRMRKYSLRYLARDKKESIFLCIDEPESRTNYGVILLGTVVRVAKPTIDVDLNGRVKVIHQTNRDCYVRSVFDSNQDGVFFTDQSYLDAEGNPYQQPRK